MKYDINNQSRLSKAFQTQDAGLQIVKPGKTATLDLREDLSDAHIAAHDRADVRITLWQEPKPKADTKRSTAQEKAADQ